MRLLFALLACGLVLGCAARPPAPPLATTYVSPAGAPLAAAPMRADGTLDAKALEAAKKAGYRLVNTDGKLLYCRTDTRLGTHIQRNGDTTCLTAQEMTEIQDRTRLNLYQFQPSHLCTSATTPGVPANPC
jgi:hypothetical protein